MRVLVANDCRSTADGLALLVLSRGPRAEVAYDGVEALARAESLRPDLALLDIAMPGLTGAEVARRLKAAARPPWLVAVTGLDPAGLSAEDAEAFQARLS